MPGMKEFIKGLKFKTYSIKSTTACIFMDLSGISFYKKMNDQLVFDIHQKLFLL